MFRQYYLLLTLILSACQQADKPNTAEKTTAFSVSNYAAHWVSPTLLLVDKGYASNTLSLFVDGQQHKSDQHIPLNKSNMPEWVLSKYPHLVHFESYTLEHPTDAIKQLIKSPLVVATTSSEQPLNKGTYVQTANLIDTLFTSADNDADETPDLGSVITEEAVQFKLWAPTALSVTVQLFNDDKTPASPNTIVMTEDDKTGIWHAKVDKAMEHKYYRYEIEVYHPASKKIETLTVTDPYSLSLSINSEYSQIIDLNHENTLPTGWLTQQDNTVENPEDNIFYETHIRDFSAHDSSLSTADRRGKYLAFTEQNSVGMTYLKTLKEAGINSIHLLPTFDIGTVNENIEQVLDRQDSIKKACNITASALFCDSSLNDNTSIHEYISQLPKNDGSRQAVVSAMRTYDNYNWGYDPYHYTVPEGSYAINPEGSARIFEFRSMIQHLHNLGFRVIMDVVYNHTHQAKLQPTAILDKIVPNYYHRLDSITGEIAQSTCCDNTATERAMMAKLMIDSLIVWTKDYKIDGFRFDLMAHQPKATMLKAREAVQAIDPDNYFYGEGWNFGEVANNQRFIQASQQELSGTEIGTFTDRLRDAVRGGAFNASGSDIRKSQGIGNGLATIPNELQENDLTQYYLMADQLRIGLAGNLANFPLTSFDDTDKLGKNIHYGDQPAGYALDPADTINYVSKHDNQTLWDNNQYRIAYHVTTHDRVRMQIQSLAFAIFSQGIPFIHMGSELLRSKGFLRDSYDYGDWFNQVDFSQQTNNYDIGLPPADKDEANWSIINTILTNNEGRDIVDSKNIAFSAAAFLDLIKVRMSSSLFRLTNAHDIIEKVRFHNTGKNQQIGLFAMSIQGDESRPSQLVFFNTSDKTLNIALHDFTHFQLHPILQNGIDSRVKQSSNNAGNFSIPPLSTAVFIESTH